MRKESDMLFLVVSLLCWTHTEGGTSVRISGGDRVLPTGGGFNLSCEFTDMRPEHVAQMWRERGHEDKVSLVNITSVLHNIIVVLSITSATVADSGYYSCMTQPPHAISPQVLIQIADHVTVTSALTTPSTPQLGSTQQNSSAAGLPGQIWYWMLLGKTTVLLLSLVTLAVKYKRR